MSMTDERHSLAGSRAPEGGQTRAAAWDDFCTDCSHSRADHIIDGGKCGHCGCGVFVLERAAPVAGGEGARTSSGIIAAHDTELNGLRDMVARRLHYALRGECPAYPGLPSACNPMVCDCSPEFEELSVEELLEVVVTRLRAVPGGPAQTECATCGHLREDHNAGHRNKCNRALCGCVGFSAPGGPAPESGSDEQDRIDAGRWRKIRPTLSADGDFDGPVEGNPHHYEWLSVDEDKLHTLTARRGFFGSVEDVIDAVSPPVVPAEGTGSGEAKHAR